MIATHRNDAVVAGVGNVFADLGLPDAEDLLARAELARWIGAIIRERGLTQQVAARVLGIDQPKVLALLAGWLSGFSLERLSQFLTILGLDVQIVVPETPSLSQTGRLTVIATA